MQGYYIYILYKYIFIYNYIWREKDDKDMKECVNVYTKLFNLFFRR